MEQRKIGMSAFLLGAINESLGRLFSTPYDFTKCKKLTQFYPVDFYYDEIPDMVYEVEGDFSCIGEMPNLHTLIFAGYNEKICVNDWSFLGRCPKIKTLQVENTNFSDCRLLSLLPALKRLHLPPKNDLEHTEVVDGLIEAGVNVFYSGSEWQEEAGAETGDMNIIMAVLIIEIYTAAKNILTDLFKNGEHYYYITLVSDGLANTPCISAWSYEALERSGCEDYDRQMIKWSYSDSPYCCHKQEEFDKVKNMLLQRAGILNMRDEIFYAECNMRYAAMETAMALLDKEGLFALNQNREEVVVLVETMPPDYTNTERAYRMNDKSSDIFREWLKEAAE